MHKLKSHKTVEQIAKKHRLEVSFIKNQLKMGIPIEYEHTKDKDLATDIALQHLDEIPDYYTRLKKMETDAKKQHKKFKDVKEGTLFHWFQGSSGKTKTGKRVKGWVQADGSPCANEPGETKTPKCFSSARLRSLKKKGKKGEALIKSAIKRKRQKDKGQQAKSGAAAPTNVPTFAKGKKDPNYVKAEPGIKEAMELKEAIKDRPGKGSGKKDACYHKVRSRYDVWPSAYASGALVKCRKVGADNWGTKSEAAEMIRYCPKCQKDETRSECKYGPKYWDMFSIPSSLSSNQMKFSIAQVHPANESKEPDHEHSMARSELSTIISAAKRLRGKLKGEGNIEAWVQSKITKAADYIDAAADYLESGEHNVEEACWSGYKQVGMKKKGKKKVPNCVPVEEGALPSPIDPQKHKEAQRTQKIYNKGTRTDNPYEQEMFLKRTGPQLPLAKKKSEVQVAHYTPEYDLVEYSNWRADFRLSEDWQKVNRQDKTDGLSQKAVNAYRRENPGSKLQTAVTEKKPKGKRAKRRKNFCSRMSGMKDKLASAKTARDPDSRINKALRRWNCN